MEFKVIVGPAGSGKSTHINKLLEENPSCLYRTATTGSAALLGNGKTINSILGFFDVEDLSKKVQTGAINKNLRYISKGYDGICIDEVSMLNAIQLDLILAALDNFNNDISNKPLGLTLVGDFLQLPIVVTGKEDYPVLPAFKSVNWSRFTIEKLSTVHRQSDPTFIELLNKIRMGEATECADWLEEIGAFHKELDSSIEGTTIFSKNADVHSYNYQKLLELKGRFTKYTYYTKGNPPPVSSKIPKELYLKPNCKVIIMTNNLKEGYSNGSIGTVIKLAKDYVKVKLSIGAEVDIEYKTIYNETPLGIVGSVEYLPLKPAYALTVHACQGLTLDSTLQCKLGDYFLRRLHGALYVILSRVKSPSLLRFVGTKKEFIRSNYIDPIYSQWA
jgi:hypothetical protein